MVPGTGTGTGGVGMRIYGRTFAVGVVLTLGVTLGAGMAAAASSPPRVHGWLKLVSPAGERVGGPIRQFKFTVTGRPGAPKLTVRPLYAVDNGIAVSVSDAGFANFADLYLASADGKPLVKGHYGNATREGFPRSGQPGMSFDFDGRGCNRVWGDFTVNHIVRAADGHIKALDVTFSQHCEQPDAPLLTGRVRYVEL